jgi:hypothetical protein
MFVVDSSTLAAGVGLAVGVAFIVIFSFAMKTELSPTDDKVIAVANNFPEAKVFFSEYADGKVEIDKTGMYGYVPLILYHYEKTYDDGRIDEVRMFIGLNALTGMPSHRTISTDCAVSYVDSGGFSYAAVGPPIVEILRSTSCAK